MSPLLGRIGRSDLRRHPLQTGLAVLGVAIAVAVVVAVDMANHSAREALRVSFESVTGVATHQVVGGPDGLEESVYTRIRTEIGFERAAPVVQGGVTVADGPTRSLTLLGLDAFAEGPFQRPLGGEGGLGDAFNDLLLGERSVALGSAEAERLGVSAGDELALRIDGTEVRVDVVTVLETEGEAARGLLLADISTAQSLLGRSGELDRIDLIADQRQADAIARAINDGGRVVPAAASANAVFQITRAFQINLTALSLLAVVVGAFLVFNTLSFLAVRRRSTIGVLRSMGVQRHEIIRLMLMDAVLIGALGTAIGLALGFALAHGLVGLVLQTITDVYFAQAAGTLSPSPLSLLAGVLVGLGGALIAAAAPASEAAAIPPRAALSRADLEQRARRLSGLTALAGGGALLLGAALIGFTQGLVAGFAGLFAIILGAAFLAPLFTTLAGKVLRPLVRGRPIGGLVVEGAVTSLSRTGVAVAALSVAVAAVIGVSVMIESFRESVIDWLEGSLDANYYVTAQAALDDAVADRLAESADVAWVSRSRFQELLTAEGPLDVWALELPADQQPAIDVRQGDPADALQALAEERAVLLSEPLAARLERGPGDRIELPLPDGTADLEVAGVYRDYGSPMGTLLIRRSLYQGLYDDDRLSGIGVHVDPTAGPSAVLQRDLEAAVADVPGAQVIDNAAIFDESLRIFDRTFAITEVLRWLAALVAFVGVVSALMALHLDRRREFAVLRAMGLGRGGMGAVVGGQSGLLGLAAGLWAIPLGLTLAGLLVFVINRRAFGWTMGFELQGMPLLEGLALALLAALLAAVYPAWRAAREPIAHGLKGD